MEFNSKTVAENRSAANNNANTIEIASCRNYKNIQVNISKSDVEIV